MGDIFSNISNATIINHSVVAKAAEQAEVAGGEPSRRALLEVANLVEQSGNQEAANLLTLFSKELAQEAPRKSLLKQTWDGLVAALPAITAAAEATQAITKLFS